MSYIGKAFKTLQVHSCKTFVYFSKENTQHFYVESSFFTFVSVQTVKPYCTIMCNLFKHNFENSVKFPFCSWWGNFKTLTLFILTFAPPSIPHIHLQRILYVSRVQGSWRNVRINLFYAGFTYFLTSPQKYKALG